MNLAHSVPRDAFVGLCLSIGVLLMVKYYPLRPARFVLGQYLWTPETGDFRRVVLPLVARFAWDGDPTRFLPVVDAISALQIAGLAVALAWGATRLADRPLLRLALLLLLCSGAASHLLATRGSQDGFVALILVGFTAAIGSGRTAAAVALGALAAAVHEGAVVYVASICALHALLAEAGAGRRWDLGRLAGRDARPAMAGLAAAVATAVAAIAFTRVSPGTVASVCGSHDWMGTVGGTQVLRAPVFDQVSESWAAVCGLQFKPFSGSPVFVMESALVGACYAPVLLATLALTLASRLPAPVKGGVAAALMLPALLTLVAFDATRIWSYMNLTALYALTLLHPHLRGFGRASPRAVLGSALAVWAVLALAVDQWPTSWPLMRRVAPDAVAARLPTFREAVCGVVPPRGPCAPRVPEAQ